MKRILLIGGPYNNGRDVIERIRGALPGLLHFSDLLEYSFPSFFTDPALIEAPPGRYRDLMRQLQLQILKLVEQEAGAKAAVMLSCMVTEGLLDIDVDDALLAATFYGPPDQELYDSFELILHLDSCKEGVQMLPTLSTARQDRVRTLEAAARMTWNQHPGYVSLYSVMTNADVAYPAIEKIHELLAA